MNYRRNEDKWPVYEGMKYNNILSVEVVTEPEAEPISLANAKIHLRVDYSAEDTYITQLIKECREELEEELNIGFATKRIKVGIRNQLGNIKLPYAPVLDIETVTDFEGTNIDSDNYTINNGVVETIWDTTVFVEYTAGYATLPNKYLRMLKERIAYRYVNRGDEKLVNQNKVWLI